MATHIHGVVYGGDTHTPDALAAGDAGGKRPPDSAAIAGAHQGSPNDFKLAHLRDKSDMKILHLYQQEVAPGVEAFWRDVQSQLNSTGTVADSFGVAGPALTREALLAFTAPLTKSLTTVPAFRMQGELLQFCVLATQAYHFTSPTSRPHRQRTAKAADGIRRRQPVHYWRW